MKKVLLFTILTFVLASGARAAEEKKADKAEDKATVKCDKAKDIKACTIKDQKICKDKIEKYTKLITRLKEIREVAVKENATGTVKALDELIAKKLEHLDKKQACLKACTDKKTDAVSKGKGCPLDSVKACSTAKKDKLAKGKSCPPDCVKACCAAKKDATTDSDK